MAQYINKSALVAEIKGYISNYKEIVAKISRNDSTWVDSVSMIESKIGVLQHLLAFLDTLEVKEVEEEYNGKAMLHVLEKGVKQGKRELIDRACEWLRKELVNFEDYSGMGEELISDFRKAMEE